LGNVNSLTLSSETLSGDFPPNSLEELPRGLDSWRLIRLDNLNVLRTCPPLEVLHYLNPKVWQSLSPRRIQTLLSSLPPSEKEIQTRPPSRITRGIQHLPEYSDKWTITEEASQTTPEDSFTSPGSPTSYTPPESPPIKFRLTKTTPKIYWRERA